MLAVVAGVGLAAAMQMLEPVRPPQMCGGIVARQSLVSETPTRHRFVIVEPWGDVPDPDAREVEVRYRGVLPDTLCEGAEVIVRGRVAGDHVDATEVLGRAASKYDPCWHPCRGEPPPACRNRELF